MANESQEFVTASPKRMRLDVPDNECNSNLEILPESSEETTFHEERHFKGKVTEICFLSASISDQTWRT